MSTYLLAFIVGEYDSITAFTKDKVQINVYILLSSHEWWLGTHLWVVHQKVNLPSKWLWKP